MEHQLLTEGLTDGLLGQIIVGGAQATGGDDDVRPAAGNGQGLFQALRVVAHHGVPEDVDPQGGEALGDGLGVGVYDVAEKQLRANSEDFSYMGHGMDLPFQGSGGPCGGRGISRRGRGTGGVTALRAGEISAMMMAVHGPKEKTTLGRECARSGKFRPNAGVSSDGARKFGSLNPAASDSVPPVGALPQLCLPTRLFCRFDARPLAPLPALHAYPVPCGGAGAVSGRLCGLPDSRWLR